MLTYLGVQRTVKNVNGSSTNTFAYSQGTTTYVNAGSSMQSNLGLGVVGAYSPTDYDTTKSYFLSRGATPMYADTMTALLIDMALMIGVTPQSLVEQSDFSGSLSFSDNAYRAMNNLRDPGNQIGTATDINNSLSPQARQIRS